ncbi:MAG: DUF2778 domain-containing protein [Lentisphaerae bacterium]|nr:DUF2778 domain-containing protein [Lentisphaerota bacterium]
MGVDQVMQMLNGKTEIKLVKFISDKGPNSCKECLKHHGEIFRLDDPNKPELPIHPNCRCKYEPIDTSNKNTAMLIGHRQIVENIVQNSDVAKNDAIEIAIQIMNARSANSKIKDQPVFLLFNGSKLVSSDGKLVLKAVSGVPVSKKTEFNKASTLGTVRQTTFKTFDYSIKRQGEENKGGLPQGLYSIECQESGSLLNGNLKKHGLGVNAWGNYHWRLLPDKNTDMRGRKPLSFTIHGGSDAQSAGCIDLTSQDTVFRKYLQSTGLTRIYVFVQYEQENVIIEEEKIISAPLMPFVY